MALKLYMDEHVPAAITRALRSRGVDVRTAQEELKQGDDDEAVLDHAFTLGRVLFTRDRDFLRIAPARQRIGAPFPGVIYAHQRVSHKQCIDDLELLLGASLPHELENRLIHLPVAGADR